MIVGMSILAATLVMTIRDRVKHGDWIWHARINRGDQ